MRRTWSRSPLRALRVASHVQIAPFRQIAARVTDKDLYGSCVEERIEGSTAIVAATNPSLTPRPSKALSTLKQRLARSGG